MSHKHHLLPVPQMLDEEQRRGVWAWIRYQWILNRPASKESGGRVCNAEFCPYNTTSWLSPWCKRHQKMHYEAEQERYRRG